MNDRFGEETPTAMRRPYPVTLLALAVFLLSAFNLLRAVLVFVNSAFLQSLDLSLSPRYLGVSASFWAVVLAAAAVGLWRRKAWGRWLTLAAIPLYHLHTWVIRLLFDASDYSRQVWPWEAWVSAVSVGVTTWILLKKWKV